MTRVQALNGAGLAEFKEYLQNLASGATDAPPRDLLADPTFLEDDRFEAEVEDRPFRDRADFGCYLHGALGAVGDRALEDHPGLWGWLALFYFEQTCPRAENGTRSPGMHYRHVPSRDYRHRYRHLVWAPVELVRWHGERARILLSLPLHQQGDIMEQIASRQGFIENPALVEALNLLYFDEQGAAPKRGVTSRSRAGNLRRFVTVVQQLDLTYDLFSMTGSDILELLPTEFDIWKSTHPERAP